MPRKSRKVHSPSSPKKLSKGSRKANDISSSSEPVNTTDTTPSFPEIEWLLPDKEQIDNKLIARTKQPRIMRLLLEPELRNTVREMAENGASISTIEARIGFPPNYLSVVLRKGKEQKDGPYRKFYRLFRQWAAEAKYVAEGILAKKSPEKWLDRSTTAKLIESSEETQINTQQHIHQTGAAAKEVLAALAILRQQRISIDEALDKGTIDISTPLPYKLDKDDDDD